MFRVTFRPEPVPNFVSSPGQTAHPQPRFGLGELEVGLQVAALHQPFHILRLRRVAAHQPMLAKLQQVAGLDDRLFHFSRLEIIFLDRLVLGKELRKLVEPPRREVEVGILKRRELKV